MRSVQTSGSTQAQRARISPACLASGTAAGVASTGLSSTHPPSCAPWLHAHYGRFIATMGALTPARLSLAGQVSLIHVHGLPAIPSPTTLRTPAAAFARYPSARRASLRLFGARSGLRHSLAGSPATPGRIEFVSLRTGHSPPVASHPASRRRGYSWLQAGERIPGVDLHHPGRAHSQAH